ncbi:nuclease [Granulicella sp. dw_53]|uniref:nuclease n=1 Tax=Granulicella sp. dw_53 TaxID=2719792 RepID=UPI002102013D|nr:nuclease [Granulicella sp. dw_53]
MMRFGGLVRLAVAVTLVPCMMATSVLAWGHDGHSMINRLAVTYLPGDVPEFLRSKAAQDAMDYYGPQPDQFRNGDPTLFSTMVPEHDINLEEADLGGPLPRRRYEYMKALAAAQAAHPNMDLSAQNAGLLPYSTYEYYVSLLSAMRDYRRELAAKRDTKPAENEIVFLAGELGHFVADGSQPLHTTINYNGWIGENPNGYSTSKKLHGLVEGDYVHLNVKAADVAPLVEPTKPMVLADPFEDFVRYLRHSHTFVEETYRLEKAGGFAGAGTPEAKTFTDARLADGAIELRNMIYTAWLRSGDPVPPYKPN